MEADFVTGPAKNLLEFAVRARGGGAGLPAVDVSIITYHRGSEGSRFDNSFVAAAKREGIPVDIVFEHHRFDRGILPQLVSAVERRSPSIVQTHNVKSHFLLRYTGLWRKHCWIAFHHGHTTTDFKMRAYNQLDRWSLRVPARVVTVCGSFARQLERMGVPADRITVQHNAIKPSLPPSEEAVMAARNEFPTAAGVPILLMVSRLSHEKGHTDALRAVAILKARAIKCHLVIVGEGQERVTIEAERERLKLMDSVTLTGHKDDVRPYFATSSLFLMPSHSEGSPNALLEAMAAGVPVIASNVGGIPELIENTRTGVLVPPRDAGELARAVERLLVDAAEASRLAGEALAETRNFTYDAYHRALVSLYENVLGESLGGRHS
jgi:glycosyltransferase involved in cell wall biosynthesis